jgi:hypothetical protein
MGLGLGAGAAGGVLLQPARTAMAQATKTLDVEKRMENSLRRCARVMLIGNYRKQYLHKY